MSDERIALMGIVCLAMGIGFMLVSIGLIAEHWSNQFLYLLITIPLSTGCWEMGIRAIGRKSTHEQ